MSSTIPTPVNDNTNSIETSYPTNSTNDTFNMTTDSSSSTPTCKLPKLPGWFYLASTVFLYSLKANIYKILTCLRITNCTKINNSPVFNTCNILCASNTVALVASIIYLRKDLTLESAKSIPRKTWLWMGATALLNSVLGPLFYNNGLSGTDVGKYSKRRRSNVAVIIVRIVFTRSYLCYCLLLNHSFPTDPNRITNCFKLFFLLQLYNYV